jgi:hypothetical protein
MVSTNQGLWYRSAWAETQNTISKITKAKMSGYLAQELEHLQVLLYKRKKRKRKKEQAIMGKFGS